MQLNIIPVAVLSAIWITTAGYAQSQPTTQPSQSQRLDQLERRLNEMEARHAAELKARDAEIEQLKSELATRPADTPPGSQEAPAESQSHSPATGSGTTSPIDQATQDILANIEENRITAPIERVPANFNPDIAVIGNFAGNLSTNNDNPARNRFGIGELELELRAAVDPRADAVVAIPFSREIDDPLFFDAADADGSIETGVEIEEAYLHLHDFGIPNLTAKLGRFHLRFGRQNLLHGHDLPTVDNNFVNQSFLGSEAISGDGLSLSYVIPPEAIGNQYVELVAEIFSGEGDEEQPVINNDASIRSPALNLHVLWNHDLSPEWNLELGGSWLTGRHNNDNRQSANLYGVDVTLIHTDPTGGFFNQLIQFEGIYGDVDTSRTDTQHAYGAYLLLQQQLDRDWYTGVRLDWTQNALDDSQEVWGISPYISWYWSEFLRFRMEYQYKTGDVPTENTLYFQATWVFGAHPPHPYWAMK